MRLLLDPVQIIEGALGSGFAELPIRAVAAARIARLPMRHRDPFARLLVAQALSEPARLITSDRELAQYSELVMLGNL